LASWEIYSTTGLGFFASNLILLYYTASTQVSFLTGSGALSLA
jgi:hypothetical protein